MNVFSNETCLNVKNRHFIFSEHKLTFTFTIYYRPSICRLSVTFVHPTQANEIFGSVATPFNMLAIC